jgi:hypothetical protein
MAEGGDGGGQEAERAQEAGEGTHRGCQVRTGV